jgi:hypothetical protein
VANDRTGTALLAILLGALVYLGCRQVLILERLRVQQATQPSEGAIMVRTDSWHYYAEDGVTVLAHTVAVVYRDSGHSTETVAEWKARFEAQVTADEARYPRITG